ncbi:MAG: hypothetical protein V3V00_10175 [Saprospiraceae bacterium]
MNKIGEAIRECQGLWKVVLAIYLFQFILVSTVGLQMKQILDASIGNSLNINDLHKGFDYTVFNDFINVHGGSFSVMYGQMRWMVLIYFIFASFISGGTIYLLSQKRTTLTDFFKGGLTFFWKFLLLDIVFTFVILAILGIVLFIIGQLFNIAPTQFDTELVFLRWTLLISIISIFLIVTLTIWKIHIKFSYIDSQRSLFHSVGSGLQQFWKNKWTEVGITFLFLALSVLLTVANYAIGDLPLLPMIILIQSIMGLKIFWRMVYYWVIGMNGVTRKA